MSSNETNATDRERDLVGAAFDEVGDFLHSATTRNADPSTPIAESLAQSGYRVVRELHRGGQGVVYEAVQLATDRTVAVKVLGEGPLANADDRARFELEVRVLARLKHPNIVTIHDSAQIGGFYFLVMDYVRGEPLDEYIFNEQPDQRSVLELFASIAEAVSVAHQNGIIHRDLKPSNVRVDEQHIPKVLDFGLAKLSDPHGDLRTEATLTQTGQFLGSIPWASPEQADGRGDLVDVRTDVYALGVMLFQMLTRRFPYDVTGSIRESLDNIVAVEPPRPSTIERSLDDEVDTIVLKALAKDRERRYQSALDLARDIRRYLAGEPIEAKSDSTIYVLRKKIRRHRVALGIATLFLLVIASSGWLAAAMHRRNAAIKTQSALAETEFYRQMLESVDPRASEKRDALLRDMLADATRQLAATPTNSSEVRANLLHTIGTTYRHLGMYNDAVTQLKEALRLRSALYHPPDPRLAETQHQLGAALWFDAQFEASKNHYMRALEQKRVLYGEDDHRYVDTLEHLAACLNSLGKVDEAERLYREALGKRPTNTRAEKSLYASTLNNLATVLHQKGNHVEAIIYFRKAVDLKKELDGELHPFVARGMTNLGGCLMEVGRFDEAEQVLTSALRIKRRIDESDNPSTAATLQRLAQLKLWTKQLNSARAYVDEALAIRRATLRKKHPDLATTLYTAGEIRLAQGDTESARDLLNEANTTWMSYPPTDRRRGDTTLALAACDAQAGHRHLAQDRIKRHLAELTEAGQTGSPSANRLRSFLADHSPAIESQP